VAPATRKRILTIAETLGYRPNRAAEFLRRGSAAAIGAFISRNSNRLYADLLIGLAETAGAQGFPLDLCFGRDLASYRTFIQGNPDVPHSGIITYPYTNAGQEIVRVIEQFRERGGKLVLLQSPHAIGAIPSVNVDECEGGRLVAAHLLQRQCSAFFTFGYYGGRIESFVSALESAGKTVTRLPGDASGLRQILCASRRKSRLGIFAAADHYALDIYRLFAKEPSRIGRDILVVGYDDMFLMDALTPALTTVHQPTHQVGVLAIHKIINMIYGKEECSEEIPPRLMIRESA